MRLSAILYIWMGFPADRVESFLGPVIDDKHLSMGYRAQDQDFYSADIVADGSDFCWVEPKRRA